jgi:hypothetical protein
LGIGSVAHAESGITSIAQNAKAKVPPGMASAMLVAKMLLRHRPMTALLRSGELVDMRETGIAMDVQGGIRIPRKTVGRAA